MKKLFLITGFLCSISLFGQNIENSSQDDDIIRSMMRLSMQQIFDTASYYYKNNSYDTAAICYNLVINAIPQNADIEQQKILLGSYNALANIYFLFSNYRMAYDLLIKRLVICEIYNKTTEKVSTYINIGVIYNSINNYDMAKQYFLKALDICTDTLYIINLLNNLGDNEMYRGNTDSAYFYINKAVQTCKQYNNIVHNTLINTLAQYFQKKGLHDSAFYYLKSSLYYSRLNNDVRLETINLSDIGNLFFEKNQIDSALYYIDLSNKIAYENNFKKKLADNYLVLSEIDKSKKRYESALNHHITYTNLKDSIYNARVFGDISQMQRFYEISKTNQQIEQLIIEQQVNEKTIKYQKIIFGILFLFFIVSFIAVYLKKKLNKISKININNNTQKELLNKIITVMEDVHIICDPDFTIDKLSDLVQSNYVYVSHVINNILKKNFRSLLNSYRIEEAKRLFSKPEFQKYTLEAISPLVGFKSSKTFRNAFQEITGELPSVHLNSMKKEKKLQDK